MIADDMWLVLGTLFWHTVYTHWIVFKLHCICDTFVLIFKQCIMTLYFISGGSLDKILIIILGAYRVMTLCLSWDGFEFWGVIEQAFG